MPSPPGSGASTQNNPITQAERGQAVQGRSERRVLCTQTSEDAEMRRPRSAWADAIQEDAGIAEIQIGLTQRSQAQRRQARAGQLEMADVEAAGVLARGFAETQPEQ